MTSNASTEIKTDGSHSILAAAIGLTNLGAPNPPCNRTTPSEGELGDSERISVQAANIRVTQAQGTSNEFMKPSYVTAPKSTMPSRSLASSNVAPSGLGRFGLNDLPPYPTVYERTRPPAAKMSSSWPLPIHAPIGRGFESRHVHSLRPPHPSSVYANPAINHFSGHADGVSSAASSRSYPYNSYYPIAPRVYSGSVPTLYRPRQAPRITSNKNFPETLFDIVSSEGNNQIISWLPNGKGFMIHDKQLFANIILPAYFDGAKFTSFTRRLKRWNFVRVQRGPELGAYYNESFVRDKSEQVLKMRYRADSMSGDAKKESDKKDCNEDVENEKLEEQIKENVEVEVQKGTPENEDQTNGSPKLTTHEQHLGENSLPKNEAQLNVSPPGLTHVQHKLSALASSPKTKPVVALHSTHLPSTLPTSEIPENHITEKTESPLSPRVYPAVRSRRHHEFQQALPVVRSMQPRAVVANGPRPVPTSSAPHSMIRSMPRYPYHTPYFNTGQRTFQDKRDKRGLNAGRISPTIHNPNQEARPSKIFALSDPNKEAMNVIEHDVKPRLRSQAVPLSGQAPHPLGSKVYRVMSPLEEAEFARYLYFKRNRQMARVV